MLPNTVPVKTIVLPSLNPEVLKQVIILSLVVSTAAVTTEESVTLVTGG